MENLGCNRGSQGFQDEGLGDGERLVTLRNFTQLQKTVLKAQLRCSKYQIFERDDQARRIVVPLFSHKHFQLVQDALVHRRINEVFVWLALEHRDEHICAPIANIFILTRQVVLEDGDHAR